MAEFCAFKAYKVVLCVKSPVCCLVLVKSRVGGDSLTLLSYCSSHAQVLSCLLSSLVMSNVRMSAALAVSKSVCVCVCLCVCVCKWCSVLLLPVRFYEANGNICMLFQLYLIICLVYAIGVHFVNLERVTCRVQY